MKGHRRNNNVRRLLVADTIVVIIIIIAFIIVAVLLCHYHHHRCPFLNKLRPIFGQRQSVVVVEAWQTSSRMVPSTTFTKGSRSTRITIRRGQSLQRQAQLMMTTTTTTTDNLIIQKEEDPDEIIMDWINHTDVTYHDLDLQDAEEIRFIVLEWYTKHRRKLPWRGDPYDYSPFDGGNTLKNNKNNKKKKKQGPDNVQGSSTTTKQQQQQQQQSAITSFFTVTSGNKTISNNTSTSTNTINVNVSSVDNSKRFTAKQDNTVSFVDIIDDDGRSSVIPTPTTTMSTTTQVDDDDGGDEYYYNNYVDDEKNATTNNVKVIPVTGYGVWVSEIMLQQTRVEAVIPYWIKWMTSFPTVHHLAAASDEEVNAHWAGLGFYRRARLLHQGAKYVVDDLDGNLPTRPEQLLAIKGIGPYTAAAIASIAYNVCVPVVDGNVCRVLSRLTGIANHIKHPMLKDKLGWKLASQIVEAGDGSHPGQVNQALMELGATYCSPSGSGIDPNDPLRDYYMSTKLGKAYLHITIAEHNHKENGHIENRTATFLSQRRSIPPGTKRCELCDPDGIQTVLHQFQQSIHHNTTSYDEAAKCGHAAFPTDPPRNQKREEDLAMAVISTNQTSLGDGIRYLMVKRPDTGLLAGQWEFPNVCVQIRDNNNNNNNKKDGEKANNMIKAPTKARRQRALTDYLLDDVFVNHPNPNVVSAVQRMSPRTSLESISGRKEPLEHIFSHVRHIMWIEMGEFPSVASTDLGDDDDDDDNDHFSLRIWTTASGRHARWMNQSDMDTVGITSGVKKVLNTVRQIMEQQQTKIGTAAKKRKR